MIFHDVSIFQLTKGILVLYIASFFPSWYTKTIPWKRGHKNPNICMESDFVHLFLLRLNIFKLNTFLFYTEKLPEIPLTYIVYQT